MVEVVQDPAAPEPIRADYALSLREYVSAYTTAARGSVGTVAAGSATLGFGILVFVVTADLIGLFFALVGLAFVSGLYIVPSIWWVTRRRPDLMLGRHRLTADAKGMVLVTDSSKVDQDWSVFRKVREQATAFMFDYGTGGAFMIPKGGFAQGDVDGFRRYLRDAGKLDSEPWWKRWARGMVIGLVVSGALLLSAVIVGSYLAMSDL